jgi:osmotically-inducible protein OsmY
MRGTMRLKSPLFRTLKGQTTMNTFKLHATAAAIALAFSAGVSAQSPTPAEKQAANDRYNASITAGRAEYAAAIEKCKPLGAADQKVCITDARAARSRSRADAKAELKRAQAPAGTDPSAAKKETPVEYVEDSVITTKVKAAVLADASLKSTEINVETYKGIVQLSGFVRSNADISRAIEVTRGIRGVTSVKNVMIVKGQQ